MPEDPQEHGPWDKYQPATAAPPEEQGPWTKYSTSAAPPAPNAGLAPAAGAPPSREQTTQAIGRDPSVQVLEKENPLAEQPSNPSTIPNARIRNIPHLHDPMQSGGRNFYEGAKTGLMAGSVPSSLYMTAPAVVGGVVGGTLGGTGGKQVAKSMGAGEFGQEVGEDVGGLAGGVLGGMSSEPAIRLGARMAETGLNQKLVPIRPIFNLGTPADDAAGVKLKVPGRDIGLTKPTFPGAPEPSVPPRDFLRRNAMMQNPVYPGAPLPEQPPVYPGANLPESPPPMVVKARGLGMGGRPGVEPSAALAGLSYAPSEPIYPGAPMPEHPGVFPGAKFPEAPPAILAKAKVLGMGGSAPIEPSGVLGRIPVVPSEPEVAAIRPKGKMGGRLILTPEEAKQLEQIQRIATQRASQRGMQYAGGMKPSGTKIPTP